MPYYLLQIDGAISKNPGGIASFGFALFKDGLLVKTAHGIIGEGPGMTNNLAEYYALVEGLSYFVGNHLKQSEEPTLSIQTDATLVEKQMAAGYQIDENNPKPYTLYAVKAKSVLKALRKMGIEAPVRWIPREANQLCDDLSKAERLPK